MKKQKRGDKSTQSLTQKKTNPIIKNYKQSFNYLKESKNYIYAVVILFFVFVLIGFLLPPPTEVLNMILEFIRELLAQTKDMGAFELIWFIFSNNLKVSLLGMLFGLFFGVVPIALAISNGYLLGFVASIIVRAEGIFYLWRILPHGIFELPAIFISLGLGLRLGLYLFFDRKISFGKALFNVLRVFFLVVIPLLIIAAVIEGVLIFLSR